MRLIRRPGRDRNFFPDGCVATIGTFDGIHIGHRKILQRVLSEAKTRNLPSVVFSFEPTPQEFFSSGTPPARLTRFREKYETLSSIGVDLLFCPPFDAGMEARGAEEFIELLLVDTLNVRHLVIGDDFRFAKNRSGTIDDLRSAGPRMGFTVEQVDSVLTKGLRVSSTAIRDALASGDMEQAKHLLGDYYRMTGRVVGGKKLGKQLGYPTANVNLNRRACPVAGIFAARVAGLAAEPLDGVASVGTRPTVNGVELLLEVHIFDFDRDIYGDYIQVEFVARLRDEVHFPDLESLTEQMHIDAAEARRILDDNRQLRLKAED